MSRGPRDRMSREQRIIAGERMRYAKGSLTAQEFGKIIGESNTNHISNIINANSIRPIPEKFLKGVAEHFGEDFENSYGYFSAEDYAHRNVEWADFKKLGPKDYRYYDNRIVYAVFPDGEHDNGYALMVSVGRYHGVVLYGERVRISVGDCPMVLFDDGGELEREYGSR